MRRKRDTALRRPRSRRQQLLKLFVQLLVWTGAAVLYYVGFSPFFDTPIEHALKRETALLRDQYDALTARYDTLLSVLGNLQERDRDVFRSLFEANPYDFDAEYAERRNATYDAIFNRSARALRERPYHLSMLWYEARLAWWHVCSWCSYKTAPHSRFRRKAF